MCLFKKGNFCVAKTPIVCKKVLRFIGSGTGYYCQTPYERTKVKLGSLMKAKRGNKVVKRLSGKESVLLGKVEVHAGIHAYVNDIEKVFTSPGQIVVHAIIPKGATYCLGENGDIVATEMFITENVVSVSSTNSFAGVMALIGKLPKRIGNGSKRRSTKKSKGRVAKKT